MTSITRTLALSLSVAASAIFLVLLGIVIWLDMTREREQAFCQAAAAILDRATASILAGN
jgi:DMSO reductase anchor subunit